MTTVHVVLPEGIDDPSRPSGGNTYDRRVCRGLASLGWSVVEHAVPASWPSPDPAARAALAKVLAGLGDGSIVLIDGLIASSVPEVLVPEATRVRLLILLHLPLGSTLHGDEGLEPRRRERAALRVARAVVTTSAWTRSWLLDHYALEPGRVHVARPGVDRGGLAPGTATGGELLCVAAVTRSKGHDVLVGALGAIRDLPWRCTCVGSVERDPLFVEGLGHRARNAGLAHRLRLIGPLAGSSLDAAYASADVLVLPSRAETYGMVVTEALAHGLPVITTAVGGLPEALGLVPGGSPPGLLVPSGDPDSLAAALRCWLGDGDLRERLRGAARERRDTLTGWSGTAARVSRVLAEVAA